MGKTRTAFSMSVKDIVAYDREPIKPQMQPSSETSSAVQTHLTIVQGVIQRMAENSRSCKLWCITLVSAVLFFAVRSGAP